MDIYVQEEINRINAQEVQSEFEAMIQSEMEDGQTAEEFWSQRLE